MAFSRSVTTLFCLALGCASGSANRAVTHAVVAGAVCAGSWDPDSRGKIFAESPAGFRPLANAKLSVARGGRIIARVASDRHGVFGVTSLSDGFYDIAVESDAFEGGTSVAVAGRTVEVILYVNKKAPVPTAKVR